MVWQTAHTASTDNILALHTDEIEMSGLDISSFAYHRDCNGGVLALKSGCDTVARIRFSGSYTTDMFEITYPSATSSVIELKPML